MPQKINLGGAIAALLLFFLPWLDIRCQEKSLITQSGIQTITGGASLSSELKAAGEKQGGPKSKDTGGMALFVLAALLCVGIALFLAFTGISSTSASPDGAGKFCAAALVLIVIQMIAGFPVEKSLREEMKKNNSGAALALSPFQIKHTPWLYLELVALAIPALAFVNRAVDRSRAK